MDSTVGLSDLMALPASNGTVVSGWATTTHIPRPGVISWTKRVLIQLNEPAGGLIASQPPSSTLTTSTLSPLCSRLVTYICGVLPAPQRTSASGTVTASEESTFSSSARAVVPSTSAVKLIPSQRVQVMAVLLVRPEQDEPNAAESRSNSGT